MTVDSLRTPAVLVDKRKALRNLDRMQEKANARGIRLRPHSKTHKSPLVAQWQIERGAVGICCAKLGEAEVFAANGIEQILMTTANVSPGKIRRAMALRARHPQFIQAVDHLQNARDLNDAAKAAGIVADVVVEVAIGTRSGVPVGDQAMALAQLVDTLPHLELRGLISYDGGAQHIKGFQGASRTDAEAFRALGGDVRADEARRAG